MTLTMRMVYNLHLESDELRIIMAALHRNTLDEPAKSLALELQQKLAEHKMKVLKQMVEQSEGYVRNVKGE